MPKALVISNLHAPDCFGGYEMVASECMDILEREHGWQIRCHCANSGRERAPAYPPRVVADLSGYFPRGWTHHHTLLPVGRHLVKNTAKIVETLQREASEADVTLLFNPRRLSTLQWIPALKASKNVVAWVSDYWPSEYPDCDKLWQAANTEKFSYSPAVMLGAARVRRAYEGGRPAADDLKHIRKAAFVSEFVLKKNAPFFPNLEEAVVLPNGIERALFPFAATAPIRQNTWGFCGRIQHDKGLALALDIFEEAAKEKQDLNFLIAGDMGTGYGREMRRKIEESPILRRHVTVLGKIPREELAAKFYHRVGVLLFTSLWEEPFALTVLEAMSCGTLVVATNTGGTGEIVTKARGILFDIPKENKKTGEIQKKIIEKINNFLPENLQTISENVNSNYTINKMAQKLAKTALHARIS
ncbi:MAG: glycosyltransferase family 4 protein [Puniceicoccales bacterium]|jgi:glycosyltransferase involved in cell wall biosynthesis|nr:glycosyltransferase family 4 protein [Puniceicoccales bacterium]